MFQPPLWLLLMSFKVYHIMENDGYVYTLDSMNGFPCVPMFEIGQLTIATPNVLACMDNLPSRFLSISADVLFLSLKKAPIMESQTLFVLKGSQLVLAYK